VASRLSPEQREILADLLAEALAAAWWRQADEQRRQADEHDYVDTGKHSAAPVVREDAIAAVSGSDAMAAK
jgi:hypothetical protein